MSIKDLDIRSEKNKEEDILIIKKILGGDNSYFKILEKKYKKIIVTLIRKMIRNEDDVADLVQETFIKAYNALDKFQFGYTFSSWLYKIASNSTIDFMRKKRFQTISLDHPISQDEDHFLEIEDNSYNADIDIISEERRTALMKAIDALPENYRHIIKLRHEDELDYSEISKQLDIPLGTVKAHLFRARKILLSELKNQRYLFVEN